VREISKTRNQFNRTPRHLFAEFMAARIDACAHGGDTFLPFPSLDQIEVGSYRPKLTLHPARQIGPVAFATILIRQDICAIWHGRPLGRGRDDAGHDRLPRREPACPQHHDPEQIELVRRMHSFLSGGGPTADVRDESLYIVIAQLAGVGGSCT
jgi:hypothetical protein